MVGDYDNEFSAFDAEELNILNEIMSLMEEEEIRNGRFIRLTLHLV